MDWRLKGDLRFVGGIVKIMISQDLIHRKPYWAWWQHSLPHVIHEWSHSPSDRLSRSSTEFCSVSPVQLNYDCQNSIRLWLQIKSKLPLCSFTVVTCTWSDITLQTTTWPQIGALSQVLTFTNSLADDLNQLADFVCKYLAAVNLGSASSIIHFIVRSMNTLLNPLSQPTKYWLSCSLKDWRVWLVNQHANYSTSSVGNYIHWVLIFV